MARGLTISTAGSTIQGSPDRSELLARDLSGVHASLGFRTTLRLSIALVAVVIVAGIVPVLNGGAPPVNVGLIVAARPAGLAAPVWATIRRPGA